MLMNLSSHPRSGLPMNYRIQSGDTLSQIAKRYNTTVGALMKANSQVKDANKIFTGRSLNIPGSRDEFVASTPGSSKPGSSGPSSSSSTQGPTSVGPGTRGPGGSPFDIAKAQLGKNAGSLKLEKNGVGASMEDWVPNDVNC